MNLQFYLGKHYFDISG